MRGERGANLVAWLFSAVREVWPLLRRVRRCPDAELVAALQRGGNVVYFRHADTGPASPEPPTVDLTRCETQRNLNDNGRAQAQEIGRQFRRLRIPVGAVLSSQFCRCKDTAQLAFGRFEVVPTLTGVARGPEFAQARRSASDGLARAVVHRTAGG